MPIASGMIIVLGRVKLTDAFGSSAKDPKRENLGFSLSEACIGPAVSPAMVDRVHVSVHFASCFPVQEPDRKSASLQDCGKNNLHQRPSRHVTTGTRIPLQDWPTNASRGTAELLIVVARLASEVKPSIQEIQR